MTIKLATPNDFSLFPHVPGEAFSLAMEVENEQVAYALFYQSDFGMISLVDLLVDPAHHGQGYGQTLLAELTRSAAQSVNGQLQWAAAQFVNAVGADIPYSSSDYIKSARNSA